MQALSQVDPRVAQLETLFTSFDVGRSPNGNGREMGARGRHAAIVAHSLRRLLARHIPSTGPKSQTQLSHHGITVECFGGQRGPHACRFVEPEIAGSAEPGGSMFKLTHYR
jgi:hypothetical protein